MGSKIRIINEMKTFFLYQNEVRENDNSLCVYKKYDIRALVEDVKEIQWLLDNNYYKKKDGDTYIPNIEYLIEELNRRIIQEQKDQYYLNYRYNIYLYKDINIEDVQLYYDFCLEIEINNIRMKCSCSNAFVDAVYVSVPYKNMELKEKLTNLLGEPEIIPEQEHDKFGSVASDYIVPISKIDKIIGIKKYRDKTKIGNCYPRVYINEEEIILDLKKIDMDIYKIFEEHGMLSLYNAEEVDPKYKYENRIIIKPPKPRSPQPPGKLSRMLTYIIKKIIWRRKWSDNN